MTTLPLHSMLLSHITKIRDMRRVGMAFVFSIVMCFLGSNVLAAGNVLILNSYHQGMDWTDGEIAGLQETIEKSKESELYIEYMDAKRFADERHLDNIRNLLAHKYRSIRLDAIVTTDNDAFEFMRRYRDALFPGVPVVFCGVNWFRPEQIEGLARFTGVAETADHAATLSLMLKLHPETDRIVAIIDTTTTGKALEQELRNAVSTLNGRIQFELWSGYSRGELANKLANLQRKTLVLLMPYAADPDGTFVTYSVIAHMVSNYSPVPVYASWDFYLGYGIVGGALTSARAQGQAAGEMLLRILAGDSVDKIPVRQKVPGYNAFDHRQLTRFAIPKSSLPEYAVIKFEPWHEIYRWLIWLAALLALAFLSLSGALWANIAKRKRADEELRIAAKAFDLQVGMVVTDENARILRVNDAFTKTTGYSVDEVVGKNPSILKSGRHDREFYQDLWRQLTTNHYWQGVIWNRRKNGGIYAEWLTIRAVLTPRGHVSQYVGSFSDITHNPEAEAEVHRLAYYDQLTGFPNRRLLSDRLGQAVTLAQRTHSWGALLSIDINGFNVINSTRGYAVGDSILLETARRIRQSLRESDTVARLGGDEFAVLVEGLGDEPEMAATRARNLAMNLAETLGKPFDLHDAPGIVSTSMGISLFHESESVEQLLNNCEIALHKAKASGRNTLQFFDPQMQQALDERSALERDLRSAVKEKRLVPYYQPQTNHAGVILGAEILLRWPHPVRGFVAPTEFIPLAEDLGLIGEIGRLVLENACRQIQLWSDDDTTSRLRLSVNVSALQFQHDDFVADVEQILEDSGADPTLLVLELTESLILSDIESAMRKMQILKSRGIVFSMDDFGTGYSSLSYLTSLPLDELKIDKSFVSRLPGSRNDEVIAQTVVSMGQSLGLSVLAEGVETEAQRDALHQYGCNAYQGYLISRPLPIDAFELFVKRNLGEAEGNIA